MQSDRIKIHKANKKGYLKVIALSFLPLLAFCITMGTASFTTYFPFFAAVPIAIVLWPYLNTKYWIENQQLFYRSAFLKGAIDIAKIKEITVGKTLWAGTKPALAKKGLLIKYNSFDKIYLAPVDNQEMLEDLLGINPRIKISKP